MITILTIIMPILLFITLNYLRIVYEYFSSNEFLIEQVRLREKLKIEVQPSEVLLLQKNYQFMNEHQRTFMIGDEDHSLYSNERAKKDILDQFSHELKKYIDVEVVQDQLNPHRTRITASIKLVKPKNH